MNSNQINNFRRPTSSAKEKFYSDLVKIATRLLVQQDRDPYSRTFGCFDRHYWSWKLTDFSEATYQRNVYTLAYCLSEFEGLVGLSKVNLIDSIKASFVYTNVIQHKDGSFDQAFPFERSFGATAFLLDSLLDSFEIVEQFLEDDFAGKVVDSLRKAAEFLSSHNETHGLISNHLAGASLSLMKAGMKFEEPLWVDRANFFYKHVLENQSSEGWYLEYDGADPGYQTLCIYYLAQLYKLTNDAKLRDSLENAVDFTSCFAHPDGSFAGEYGSRRTAIFYPGGLALLGKDMPVASSLISKMLDSYLQGKSVEPHAIDMGNLAPLAANYILMAKSGVFDSYDIGLSLPCDKDTFVCDFLGAGLSIRGNKKYYAVIGISNGGVVKIFDKMKRKKIFDDCGYVGQLENGTFLTTQIRQKYNLDKCTSESLVFDASFYEMIRTLPTPAKFIILRILNVTLMRNVWFGNFIKSFLVKMLVSKRKKAPVMIMRSFSFLDDRVEIIDQIICQKKIDFKWLEAGRRFVAIHMASSRYFSDSDAESYVGGRAVLSVDVRKLSKDFVVEVSRNIQCW